MINTLIPLIHPIPSRSTFCSGFGVAALECHPLIDSSALAHPKLGSETPRLPGYPRGGLSFLLNVPEICTWCCFYVQLRSKWSNKVQIQRELQLHQFFGTKKWRGKILTWLAGSGCLLHVFCWKTFRPRPPYWKRNLLWIPCWKGDNGCTNLAWNGLLSPSCMQLSGSILLCAWIGCLWLHLQKERDWWQASAGLLQSIFTYGFYKTLYSTGKAIHSKTAPVASGIAAPPLACHWRFAELPADQLTLQGNRDSTS